MDTRAWKFLFLLCCCLIVGKLTAQNITNNGPTPPVEQQNIDNYFNTALKRQLPLYNGHQYEFYSRTITGTAYFKDATTWNTGSLNYDGSYYTNIPLLYDIVKDVLVSYLPDGYTKYALVSGKVNDFYLLDHHFIYLNDSLDTKGFSIKAGFYDQLYIGHLQVWAKRVKTLQNDIAAGAKLKEYFSERTYYYLKKDNKYYVITNESSFTNLFKDIKKELQQQLKANKTDFKNDTEKAIIMLATYYDQTTRK